MLIVAGWLLTSFGGLSAAMCVRDIRRARRSRAWPTTTAVIIDAPVIKSPQPYLERYAATARYSFNVAGVVYHGDRIRFGAASAPDRAAAERVASRFHHSATTTVHYNPANPHEAVLITGESRQTRQTLNRSLVASAIGIAVLVIGYAA